MGVTLILTKLSICVYSAVNSVLGFAGASAAYIGTDISASSNTAAHKAKVLRLGR
jgi:hypothetical protein